VFFFGLEGKAETPTLPRQHGIPVHVLVGMLENNGKGCYCSLSAFFPLYPTSFFNASANFLLLLYMFFFKG
jgi:hypothetical protein